MMVAQKCSKNRTSNYHVFDMNRGGFQTVSFAMEGRNGLTSSWREDLVVGEGCRIVLSCKSTSVQAWFQVFR